MVVDFGNDGTGQRRTRSGPKYRTVTSLIEGLREKVFGGLPPEEFAVASEPWGSFAFRPGDVTVLAAPPGEGKTAFAAQATFDAMRLSPNASCLFLNVEMTPEKILERQLSRLSGVPFEQISRCEILPGQRDVLDAAFATLESIGDQMVFMEQPFSIEHVVEAVAEVQPKILVLDYLQRIECCDGVADTRVRLNTVMHESRIIANAGVSVFLISAVGRTQSKKGGGYNANELGMGSFRESSEVEYGADDAYVMVSEGGVDKATGCRTVVMRHVKSRNHRRQDIRLEFHGATQQFSLLPDQDVDFDEEDEDGDGDEYCAADWVASPEEIRRGRGRDALPGALRALPHSFVDESGDAEQPKV